MAVVDEEWDEMTAKLPGWARPPRGKGVTGTLRTAVIAELAQKRVVFPDFKPNQIRSYQALVLELTDRNSGLAETIVTKVLQEYRRKHSKRYLLE